MGLETGDTISDLNPSWPLGSDPKSQGDDHLRLLKAVFVNDVISRELGGIFLADIGVETAGLATLNIGSGAGFNAQLRFHEEGEEKGRLMIGAGNEDLELRAFFGGVNQNRIRLSTNDSVGGIRFLVDGSGADAARIDVAGTVAVNNVTVITREKGDQRYLTQNGGTMTGQLVINVNSSQAIIFVRSEGAGAQASIGMFDTAEDDLIFSDRLGDTFARLRENAAFQDSDLLKKSDGDGFYLPQEAFSQLLVDLEAGGTLSAAQVSVLEDLMTPPSVPSVDP